MRRSLTYFWRSHLAVGLGAAVATAVLTGALLVGDSLRGSLSELAAGRLGSIHHAVAGGGFFRSELADELAGDASSLTVPAILLRGSAVHAATSARASKLQVIGIDSRFANLYPTGERPDFSRSKGQIHPSVVVNAELASELGAEVGDEVVLTFERPAEIPRETIVGRDSTAESIAMMRLEVRQILPVSGLGGFTLVAGQAAPRSAFLELDRLQREIFGRRAQERVNLLLTSQPDTDELTTALRRAARPEDLGLVLRGSDDFVVVESREFVLPPNHARAVEALAAEIGAAAVQPVLTHLANSIELGDRAIPYSTVAALDPLPDPTLGRLWRADGTAVETIDGDEILLNSWAAADLDAEPGDLVTISYYVVGARDELTVETARFRVAGVVRLAGLAADRRLTPEFPGMHDAEDISAWDPPFPVDLDRIRDRDEQYWDLHGATPKAFIAGAAGRRLWTTRFGDRTSVRMSPPDGTTVESFTSALLSSLPDRLGSAGLTALPVRADALRQARGATDFAGLFFGLSLFLIVSAALLVGLLFRLAVEQRAREAGLLRAVGFTERQSRRRFLREGLAVAALGALVGVGGGIGYAWLMLTGLRTWWLPAIGAPVLFLHVDPPSLLIGFIAALGVVAATIWLALRALRRVAAPSLLAGSLGGQAGTPGGRRPAWIAAGSLLLAGTLFLYAVAGDRATDPVLAFVIGALLLIAGLAAFASRSARAGGLDGAARATGTLLAMSIRNSARHRTRSVLSVALIASAVFSIVAVAANRGREDIDVSLPSSGAGGFELVAESDVPILDDLRTAAGRAELGLPAGERPLDDTVIIPLRLLPGEDASCLNLYRPEKPRVLGVPGDLVARGAFSFQQAISDEPNPWQLLELDLGPGVVPAIGDFNSVVWILHSGLGKDVLIIDESGREIALRFVGLLKKSIFQSEILIAEERFTRLFPRRAGSSFFLIDPPESSREPVRETLESSLGRYGFDVTPTAERLAAFQAIENTYISTFETLGGLGLVLGTLGLGVVLLRNVIERRSELATLRAFGFRRRRLAAMVLFENAYLLLAGVGIGSLAGISAAFPHLFASGGDFPWLSLGLTLAAVLAVGVLASLAAVGRVLRAPLISALRSA